MVTRKCNASCVRVRQPDGGWYTLPNSSLTCSTHHRAAIAQQLAKSPQVGYSLMMRAKTAGRLAYDSGSASYVTKYGSNSAAEVMVRKVVVVRRLRAVMAASGAQAQRVLTMHLLGDGGIVCGDLQPSSQRVDESAVHSARVRHLGVRDTAARSTRLQLTDERMTHGLADGARVAGKQRMLTQRVPHKRAQEADGARVKRG